MVAMLGGAVSGGAAWMEAHLSLAEVKRIVGELRAPRPAIYWADFLLSMALVRFFVLTPLTWFSEHWRNTVHRHASSLVINARYVRADPTPEELRIIRWQELGCFLWCLGIAVVPPVFLNRWPIPGLIQAYATAVLALLLNALRTLGAHRYGNDGRPVHLLAQILDSVNYPYRPWFTELWGPVGLRHHAIHHLQPTLPYHALPEAHRRLMGALPLDSPYRSTVEISLAGALRDLWRRSRAATRVDRPDLEDAAG
jgi:Fatty acid desaturase